MNLKRSTARETFQEGPGPNTTISRSPSFLSWRIVSDSERRMSASDSSFPSYISHAPASNIVSGLSRVSFLNAVARLAAQFILSLAKGITVGGQAAAVH